MERTDLLRRKIISDGFLETLANPLLGDGIEVAFRENGIDCFNKLVARF